MYLKRIEMAGFKSFADRTKLNFEPGMMAIVGPNGCGKSNVSDAIRWVLGEQSAKAMRGGAMTDVIFSGTDSRKAVGMAEVSLTFSECEGVLETEFSEVTITRRVLRTGEGSYFINKAPCRLKDIQRLFLGTGIGTDSYSILEQGKIDQILSSRPDDRRAVFEEASGITKYKTDKKEALRKLEQSEANLLRLADIIREVKRQIISLQRQAGKAKRYKEIQDQLRQYDVFLSKKKLVNLETSVQMLETRLSSFREQEESLRAEVESSEKQAQDCRAAMASVEQAIGQSMENGIQARTELGRVGEVIAVNQDRIREYQSLSESQSRDVEEAESGIQHHSAGLKVIVDEHTAAKAELIRLEKQLEEKLKNLREVESLTASTQDIISRLRNDLVTFDGKSANLQNELSDLDARERSTVVRRERLTAEKADLQHTSEVFEKRLLDLANSTAELEAAVQSAVTSHNSLKSGQENREKQAGALNSEINELKSKAAAQQGQIDILKSQAHQTDGFSGGARWLLENKTRVPGADGAILGSLADKLQAEPGYEAALESCLRAWLDAVVVSGRADARRILSALKDVAKGSARLLFADGKTGADCPAGAGTPLLEHVTFAEEIRPTVSRLLWNVRVVDTLEDLPREAEASTTYVTREGNILRGDGSAEFWSTQKGETNPLARRHKLKACEDELKKITIAISSRSSDLEKLRSAENDLRRQLIEAQEQLDGARKRVAQREGEVQVVTQEARQAKDRFETVSYELDALTQQNAGTNERRATIVQTLEQLRDKKAAALNTVATKTTELKELDAKRNELLGDTTDHRVKTAEHRQQVENLSQRKAAAEQRIAELSKLVEERRKGINSYSERISHLNKDVENSKGRIAPLEMRVADLEKELEGLRSQRAEQSVHLKQLDDQVREKRKTVDELVARRSEVDVHLAEERMRHQTLIDRVAGEWKISPDELRKSREPEWGEAGQPDPETLETTIGEFRARLESMGPVNLVAIDEHKELEERYAFLVKEEEDLNTAKTQLIDTIRRINQTTTEMFSETFQKVNEHFQEIFRRMFGGGTAKLVLLDEQDVLESGIEIIARPPGKKLQTVSLLSGGERTMTAVALLFSLYSVKPSAFCVLDELDAALDDANIGRFVSMLESFLKTSQFIVITHNRRTIAAADVLYGITMKEGVSDIISARFRDHEKPQEPTAAAEPQLQPEGA